LTKLYGLAAEDNVAHPICYACWSRYIKGEADAHTVDYRRRQSRDKCCFCGREAFSRLFYISGPLLLSAEAAVTCKQHHHQKERI